MKNVTVDCAGIADKAALHQAFAAALTFPDYYGNNLDALYDCLTEIQDATTLTLLHFDALGGFRAGFQAVLEEAEAENPHLIVNIQ